MLDFRNFFMMIIMMIITQLSLNFVAVFQVEWPFGHGLSYTTFTYSALTLSDTSIDENGSIDVTISIKNDGDMAGKETVLLFVYDMYRRVTPEYKLLKR